MSKAESGKHQSGVDNIVNRLYNSNIIHYEEIKKNHFFDYHGATYESDAVGKVGKHILIFEYKCSDIYPRRKKAFKQLRNAKHYWITRGYSVKNISTFYVSGSGTIRHVSTEHGYEHSGLDLTVKKEYKHIHYDADEYSTQLAKFKNANPDDKNSLDSTLTLLADSKDPLSLQDASVKFRSKLERIKYRIPKDTYNMYCNIYLGVKDIVKRNGGEHD